MFDLRFVVIQDRFDKARYQVKSAANTLMTSSMKQILFLEAFRGGPEGALL